jgi:hypothetical protein
MKNLPALWSLLLILGCAAGLSRAADQNEDLAKKLMDINRHTTCLAPVSTDSRTNIFRLSIDFAAALPPANTNLDASLMQELRPAQADFEKLKPGLTRAELVKLFQPQNPGFTIWMGDDFQPHQSFSYLRCRRIFVDVDFAPSNYKTVRPADVITKVSQPYIFTGPIF